MPLWSDEADFSFINNWSFYPTTQWQVKRGPSLEELPRTATERHTHEKQHLLEDAVSEELRMLRRGKTRTFSFFFSLQISPHWSTKRYFSKTFFFFTCWLINVCGCVCMCKCAHLSTTTWVVGIEIIGSSGLTPSILYLEKFWISLTFLMYVSS